MNSKLFFRKFTGLGFSGNSKGKILPSVGAPYSDVFHRFYRSNKKELRPVLSEAAGITPASNFISALRNSV
jgi:hypothetical protein